MGFGIKAYAADEQWFAQQVEKLAKEGNVYIVAQDGTGDFLTIQEGVDAVNSGDTLIICPGIYEENVEIMAKTVNLLGVDRDSCILQYDTVNYGKVPLTVAAGQISNITIGGYKNADKGMYLSVLAMQEEAFDEDSQELLRQSAYSGYAVHVDQNYLYGKELSFEKCRIESYNSYCMGIGSRGESTITVTSKGDGLKASNSTDPQKGYIILEGGTVTINSENDGVQAESSLLIKDGIYNITTTGTIASSSDIASSNTEATSDSFKALKATSDIYVTGGTFVIDSSDDAVHSNNTVTIEDGSFTITSADDGMHADDALTINGGTIDILKSYEGLEGASIVINNGTISLVATDDGINAAGGSDSTENPGMFGKDQFSSSGNYFLEINGGSLHVNADGDGLDANGYIKQTGGTVTVDGPTNGGNGALDYDSTYDISGGILIATGSQDMAMATSSSSTQNTIYIAYTSPQAANQMITLKDASGNTIYSYTPSKEYQSVVISTPDIVLNETYSLYSGETKLCDVTPTSNVASFSDTGETVSTPTGMNGMGGGGGRGQMGGDKGQMGERPDRGTTDGSAPGTTDGEPPVMPSGDPAGL